MVYQGKQRPHREEFEITDDDLKEQGQPDSSDMDMDEDEDVDVDVRASGQSRNPRR
jgi:hypothetical protein